MDHYAEPPPSDSGGRSADYRDRAERQVRLTLTFVPRYLVLAGGHAARAGRAGRAVAARPGGRGRWSGRLLLGLTLLDLFGFGFGLNPAIAAADDRPEAPVIAYLRREVGRIGPDPRRSARNCRRTP